MGYVRGGDVLELSVADPALGTVFYTLAQTASAEPRFVRQTDDCLLCHGGPQTRGVPGHVLRSVYPDASGPTDGHGRSLRALDLETRLLRYPCSHLISTANFAALPDELRGRFWTRLDAALADRSDHPSAGRLAPADRRALREILAATVPAAPAAWRAR